MTIIQSMSFLTLILKFLTLILKNDVKIHYITSVLPKNDVV